MEAKDAIKKCTDAFEGCVVVDINPYKDGFLCRVVPKEYSKNPDQVLSDSIIVMPDGSLKAYNPLLEVSDG